MSERSIEMTDQRFWGNRFKIRGEQLKNSCTLIDSLTDCVGDNRTGVEMRQSCQGFLQCYP